MAEYPEVLERLCDKFRSLEGIGKKTAMRLALSVVDMDRAAVEEFADALISVKNELRFCSCCQNIATGEICDICSSDDRDHSVICVVEDYRAAMAIEKVREFKGMYHVLHGVISPMKGIGPDKLKIKELLSRLDGSVKEVILATNPTPEGETTAMYLARLLAPLGIKTSRIANGMPVGGDLDYADELTLRRALEGRYNMK
ncbi:MAG: recombination protein RecR [Clostridia bacterium]|nr:recombination protein RecR [Clostridia bacterium]MBR6650271.1 recombination protein RecR [Clostridia bacterium]